ncbi:2-polyprenyl-3-methyl-5-hydroxy-6-metoxy-1,4-benzoquinol methylase [Pseudarthrobacter niigatensis]|uniref:2-polyprenyl-3-methyl-5-hydroxy-6-metoxy-1, 4-benzoquinol methylase n=2 Tax=Pseudarthrobacter niigatensis TaxID=369935 RepID=A0AAJ1SNZ8_9MICC|nr:2-polyprenyl-3-methyl-5-hydroxy-6-metoxy-1,4-benzoquinol methylase [Pseudarthrobacter niigatensis]MDQ0266646.1 2-polyprenyl-3-methyl-5-hydroxy-6-metoxy-1,4-benzoquinol methylase [Pseudarthrobacter niigatensis]
MGILLRTRAAGAVEQMDRADCDARLLDNTYRQFWVINRVLSGWRRLYRTELRTAAASQQRPLTVLDIGSGGGDLAVMLARWAERDGRPIHVTGIDPDPRAAAFARRRPAIPGVDFRQAHSGDLVREGARFDVVISNHVLHHLDRAELRQLLSDSEILATRKALHNDLIRSPAAFALFSVAALPFRKSYIRGDGLTSIRRSYTPAELAASAPPGWSVERPSAFHQVLACRKD